MKILVSAVLIAVTCSPAFAQASGPLVPRKNPYRNLFVDPKPVAVRAHLDTPAPPAKPIVVCGMTIIPADPSVDPKMPRVQRDQTKPRPTIRAVDPPICKP